MVNTNESTLEYLESLYNRISKYETPKTFFLSLFEYMEEYENNPILKPIWKSITKLGKKDNAPLKRLEKKILIDIDKAYQEVKQYVEKNSVTNTLAVDAVKRYEAHKNGTVTTSQNRVEALGGYVTYALLALLEDNDHDYFPFVKKFGTFIDNKHVKEWTLSPSYLDWQEQQNYIDRIKLAKVWYSWDQIAYFYNLYKDYEKMRRDYFNKKQFINLLGLNDIFRDLNETISWKKDPKRYLKTFDVGDYQVHFQRVHSYVKRQLQSEQQEKVIEAKYKLFSFIENVLSINGKEVKFKRDTRKFRFIKLLLANPKGIYFGEITEQLEGASIDGTKDVKNICYEMCRGIQNSLAKIGVTDFLEYDYNQAKINKNYKITSN